MHNVAIIILYKPIKDNIYMENVKRYNEEIYHVDGSYTDAFSECLLDFTKQVEEKMIADKELAIGLIMQDKMVPLFYTLIDLQEDYYRKALVYYQKLIAMESYF